MRNQKTFLALTVSAVLLTLGFAYVPGLAAAADTTISSLPVFRYINGTTTAEPRITNTQLRLPVLAGADCIGANASGTLIDNSGSCGGGGGTTTTINGVSGPSFTLTATSSSSTLSWSGTLLTIPKNISFFTNNAGYATLGGFSATAPLSYDGSGVFSIAQSSAGADGYLSSGDWSLFDGKQDALSFGDVQGASNQISVSGGTGAVIGSGVSLSLPQDIGTGSNVQFNDILAGNAFKLSGAADGCATFVSTEIQSTGSPCGSGGGIASINALTATDQFFATSTSGGLSLNITSASATHTFTLAPASGYSIPLTASTTNWQSFYTTPSGRITDGAGLTWSGNTLNCDTASGSVLGCLSSSDWTTFNGKQAGDSTLTSLAAYNTNGILTQTAADTFTGRTITGTSNQVVVTNGDGVSGNPTLSLPQSIATSSSPTFAGLTLTSFSGFIKATAGALATALINLTSDVTGILPIANGGTNASTTVDAYNNLTVTDATPDTNSTANGPTSNTFNAGATIAAFEVGYLDASSTWQLTDADSSATSSGMLAMSLESKTSGQAMKVALPGAFVRNDTWNWTAGGTLYLSTTAGALTQTQPSGVDDVIRVVGWAVNADVIFWSPSEDYMTHI